MNLIIIALIFNLLIIDDSVYAREISFGISDEFEFTDTRGDYDSPKGQGSLKDHGSDLVTFFNPWGNDDDENCAYLPWISIQESPDDIQYLLVRFNANKRIPIYSIYEHNENTDKNLLGRLTPFYEFPCDRLKGHQLRDSEYTNTGWSRGHLSPQMAFRYSEEARAGSNYLVNIAPQDLHTNTVPWSSLEQKLHKFMYGRKGIVITGVCNATTTKQALPVPDCFWKIVCTSGSSGHVTAAVFYHHNSMVTTDIQKLIRKEEIFKVREMSFVEGLIARADWSALWSEAPKQFYPNSKKSTVTLQQCQHALHLTQTDRTFWENAIF